MVPHGASLYNPRASAASRHRRWTRRKEPAAYLIIRPCLQRSVLVSSSGPCIRVSVRVCAGDDRLEVEGGVVVSFPRRGTAGGERERRGEGELSTTTSRAADWRFEDIKTVPTVKATSRDGGVAGKRNERFMAACAKGSSLSPTIETTSRSVSPASTDTPVRGYNHADRHRRTTCGRSGLRRKVRSTRAHWPRRVLSARQCEQP